MSLSKKKLATLERKSELYRKRTRDIEIEEDVQEEINKCIVTGKQIGRAHV